MTNESYEDTIIRIIGNEEKGYVATVGKYKITEKPYKNKEELIKMLNDMPTKYSIIMVMAMIEAYEEAQNNKEE